MIAAFRMCVAVLTAWVAMEPAAAKPPRPNIIFLLTDDQRDGTLAAMGHPYVQTPHLDRLMRESVRFRNAYAPSPVCAPSRVSYFTGMLERVHGVGFTSDYELTQAQWDRTYPALLRKSGYHTGFIGKFGVEYYEFRGRAADRFDFCRAHDGWTKFFPKDHDNPSCTPYHGAKNDIITLIMGEAACEFLDTAPASKPFCLSISFNVPHGSQVTSMHDGYPDWHRMTRPANENPKLRGSPFYDTLYRDIDIALPADTATDPYRFIPKAILDQDKGRRDKTYVYDYDRDTCREHHVRYHQQITGLDHVIGQLRAELQRRGLADDTVIIFGSDHGLLLGEYGMGGKELLYDLSAKIPCIVHAPRLPESLRGRQLDHLVSGIDVTKTILDYAGVEAPEFMDGSSLRPLVEGKETRWRDHLFLESLFTGRDTPLQEGIRTPRWKYIRMYDGVTPWREQDVDFRGRPPEFEMLFNVTADPGERDNLAAIPAHTAILAELRTQCAAESVALNERREAFKAAVQTKRRGATPNVLFILCDDLRPGAVGCYGSPHVKTPHIDGLARDGVRFANAFCTTSLCSPSRASILTGLYAHAHGVRNNFTELPPALPHWPGRLRDRGYATAYVGKWHMGEDNDAPRPGFDFFVSHKGQGKYFDTEWNVNGERRETPPGYYTNVVTDYSLDWLERLPRGKPWALCLGHKAPHSFYFPEPKYAHAFDGVPVAYPQSAFQLDGKPDWIRQRLTTWHGIYGPLFEWRKNFPDTRPEAVKDFENMVHAYWGTILSVDDSVGRLVEFLRSSGQLDNTVIVFMGDNGLLEGEHGMVDKRTMHEPSIRIPIIARGPGLPAGKVVSDQVLTEDIAPSVLDLCHAPALEKVDGRSWVRLCAEGDPDWRTAWLYEYNYEKQFPYTPNIRGIRTDRWKFMRYPHGDGTPDRHQPELYDLETDPGEVVNLAADPDHATTRADLEKQLAALMASLGLTDGKDQMPIDEGIKTALPDAKNR